MNDRLKINAWRSALWVGVSFCLTTTTFGQSEKVLEKLESIEKRLEAIENRLPQAERMPTRRTLNVESVKALPKRSLESTGGGFPPAAADTDHDGLADAEETALGTDSSNEDTDGDALLDGWEVHGVNGLDLASLGANPLRKDIFVEMDFMKRASATNGLAPSDAVLEVIRELFKAARVSNPDGSSGITIHLEKGNEIPHDGDLNPAVTEFGSLKLAHFDPKRAPVFHYMIWADRYNGGTSSGNAFNIPSSDFIVTLGAWGGGKGGTDAEKIGTFIHELGHDLGLRHGGSDHVGNKPNHLSVMNYSFQTSGVPVNGIRLFDYQRFPLPSLTTGTSESVSQPRAVERGTPRWRAQPISRVVQTRFRRR